MPAAAADHGDPAALATALLRVTGHNGRVGLLHLPVYSDDRQLVLYLVQRLQEQGLQPCLVGPQQLRWMAGQAMVDSDWYRGPVDAVFRFLPAGWLPRLPTETAWRYFFARGRTPLCNPGVSVLSQSRRFPLAWPQLAARLPTWQRLLPETQSPQDVEALATGDWVLKPALGFEGNNIGLLGVTEPAIWRQILRGAGRNPSAWAAQRRFTALPIVTPDGPLYPSIGVYVIDGRTAGIFARASEQPLIDHNSREIIVLLRRDNPGAPRTRAKATPKTTPNIR